MFFTDSHSCAYPAFTLIFEAFEVLYFRSKTVLQFPGHRYLFDEPALVPEEFVTVENVNLCKDVSSNEGVNADDKTVKTSNLLLPPQDEEPLEVI